MSRPSAPQLMIRPARELAGISMRELARRIGVSVGTMSGIETGKTVLSDDRFTLIAEALGSTPEAIAELTVPDADDAGSLAPQAFDWRDYGDLDLDPVLGAAITCFVSTGYHGATMRSVAAEAGISVPGVYHHYPNKQSLLVAIFQVASSELTAHLRAAVAEAVGTTARLSNLSEATVLFAARRRELASITMADRNSLTGAPAATATADMAQLVAEFAQPIADIGAVTDVHGAARAAVQLCLSVCRWFDGDADEAAATAAEYADYVRGLAGAP